MKMLIGIVVLVAATAANAQQTTCRYYQGALHCDTYTPRQPNNNGFNLQGWIQAYPQQNAGQAFMDAYNQARERAAQQQRYEYQYQYTAPVEETEAESKAYLCEQGYAEYC